VRGHQSTVEWKY